MSVLSDADYKESDRKWLGRVSRSFQSEIQRSWYLEARQLVENSGAGKSKQPLANSKLIYIDAKDLSLKLILALPIIPSTHALPSRIDSDSGTLLIDVFNLRSQITLDKFSIGSIIPLFEKIDSYASDLKIYNTLFALVARPATSPRPLLYVG
jgi:hypothetical protein